MVCFSTASHLSDFMGPASLSNTTGILLHSCKPCSCILKTALLARAGATCLRPYLSLVLSTGPTPGPRCVGSRLAKPSDVGLGLPTAFCCSKMAVVACRVTIWLLLWSCSRLSTRELLPSSVRAALVAECTVVRVGAGPCLVVAPNLTSFALSSRLALLKGPLPLPALTRNALRQCGPLQAPCSACAWSWFGTRYLVPEVASTRVTATGWLSVSLSCTMVQLVGSESSGCLRNAISWS